MSKNTSLVSKNTLKILMLFADHEQLSVRDISTLLNLNLSAVYRIINTMKEENFVIQLSNKNYMLNTPVIIKLYNRVKKDIKEIARPIIKKLAQEFDETVYLSELYNNEEVVVIELFESTSQIRWTDRVGTTYKIPSGSAGKTHLAYLIKDMDEQQKLEFISGLELIAHTEKTITDPVKLYENVTQVIRDGYLLTEGEHVEGALGISVPILTSNMGATNYVLSMSMVANRFDYSKKEYYITKLQEAAKQIGANLPN